MHSALGVIVLLVYLHVLKTMAECNILWRFVGCTIINIRDSCKRVDKHICKMYAFIIWFAEAEYATKTNKHIIPLKYEKDFEPTGWLGLLMGSELYYLVHSDEDLMSNLPKIKQALDKHGVTKGTSFCLGNFFKMWSFVAIHELSPPDSHYILYTAARAL